MTLLVHVSPVIVNDRNILLEWILVIFECFVAYVCFLDISSVISVTQLNNWRFKFFWSWCSDVDILLSSFFDYDGIGMHLVFGFLLFLQTAFYILSFSFLHLILLICLAQVKTCHLPHLPEYKQLISQLEPIYARLSSECCNTQRHPVYRCSDIQVSFSLSKNLSSMFYVSWRQAHPIQNQLEESGERSKIFIINLGFRTLGLRLWSLSLSTPLYIWLWLINRYQLQEVD